MECQETMENKIRVHCEGQKCVDWARCKMRHYNVWHIVTCHCGNKKITPNPKIKTCSHSCVRRLNKMEEEHGN
jgi:hypothetical protein